MFKLMALFVLFCVSISGCTHTKVKNVEVYTFKKERVDQKIEGNQGYLTGTPPEIGPRDTKRTLIGVDIELPAFGKSDFLKKNNENTTSVPQENAVVTVVGEEEWIK